MIRRLLFIAIAVAGFLVLRGLLRGRGPGRRDAARGGTPLVRDRVCNTFVPRDRALSLKAGSAEVIWFCSQECRSRYLAGESGKGATALVL